jgi:hypothetical protein
MNSMGFRSFVKKDHIRSQQMMRFRVIAQAATIITAMVGGTFFSTKASSDDRTVKFEENIENSTQSDTLLKLILFVEP